MTHSYRSRLFRSSNNPLAMVAAMVVAMVVAMMVTMMVTIMVTMVVAMMVTMVVVTMIAKRNLISLIRLSKSRLRHYHRLLE